MIYVAPLKDMQFVLEELVDLSALLELKSEAGLTPELVFTVLEEADRLAAGVLAPADRPADREGVCWTEGDVSVPAVSREAYRQFIASGWHSLPCRSEFGGQDFPRVVSALVDEIWR